LNKTAARAGDIVDVTIDVLPNHDGYDRQFNLSTVLPAGLRLVPDSFKNNSSVDVSVSADGNTLTLTGVQPNTANKKAEYVVTTNDTSRSNFDAQCVTPSFGLAGHDGKYLNLRSFGTSFVPSSGFAQKLGDTVVGLPWTTFWSEYPEFALYNHYDYPSTSLKISPLGYVWFDDFPKPDNFNPTNAWFVPSYQGFPQQIVGVLWKRAFGKAMGYVHNAVSADEPNNAGITLGKTEDTLIIEWDNGTTLDAAAANASLGDKYDFELIMNRNIRHAPGQHEFIMAYDNLNFLAGDSFIVGSAGVHGFKSPMNSKPTEGYLNSEVFSGYMSQNLKNDLVACLNYVGPESSIMALSFQVQVEGSATGQTLPVVLANQVTGLDNVDVQQTLKVTGNLVIGHIDDQEVDEDETLEGIQVAYADSQNTTNVISVSGEGFTSVVHGHTPGSEIDIIPNKDFNGETEVTVTVTDTLYPGDAVSTTFMLTVNAKNDAPIAVVANATINTSATTLQLDASGSHDPDGDALSFSWSQTAGAAVTMAKTNEALLNLSALTAGDYSFRVVVSDGAEESYADVNVKVTATTTTVTATSHNGGGSVPALLVMMAVALVFVRRRK
jgi:hypothetical protein